MGFSTEQNIDRLIDDDTVAGLFGLSSRVSVWRYVKTGKIPKPVVREHKFTRWSMNEVQAAIAALRNAERQEAAS